VSARALHVETPTHGRVLVRDAAGAPSRGLFVAFHGYAQSAEIMIRDLEGIEALGAWTVVSVQGLHRFYTRGDERVVASWMTRQDREQAIADNIAYVDRAIDAVGGHSSPRIVFAGFSQGVAMAWRAAMLGRRRAAGIVALAGDIPPDVDPKGAPPVLIGAGLRDTWFTPAKRSLDVARLVAAGVIHEVVAFDGAHEWTDEFRNAVSRWIDPL
jgi:predicted esterase